jgi:putative tryptophan/tyrosine transport system substrate-binding protein
MSKRHVISWLPTVIGLLAASVFSLAQPPAKVHRIGFLAPSAISTTWRAQPNLRAFLEGLRELGYVEGQNLAIEFRTAEGKLDRLPDLAADLVESRPDVILIPTCGAPLDAARRATNTIPIVVAACTGDMVAAGIVASLARPGGNVTGQQKLNPELAAKRLELLKGVLPKASRVAVLWDPGYSDFAADWGAMRLAAETLGVTLHSVEARAPTQLETAFSTMTSERADAFITFADSLTYVHARKVADLAATSRVPAMYAYREITEAGGLMSYGPNIPDMFRRATVFIDKILKGAKPADLPVEQPTNFELVINLKTAKALGITIPQSILLRADKVIE